MASITPDRRPGGPRQWRAALALLAVLWLTACSTTAFFYNRLDFLVPWYLDDYVELDREQDRQLDRLLAPFLEWHRREELPRYAALLDELEDRLDRPLTAADLEHFTREVEIAGDRVQTHSLDWLLGIGEQLSEEQLAEFIANLREKQEELEEEYLERDLEEYREESYDRLLDNCQDYLGRLDREQREALRASVEELQRFDSLWLDERAAWIDRLEQLLRREPGWEQRVREAVATRWADSSEAYRQMYSHNLVVVREALRELVNGRSERQDRHLRRRLENLREDFLALSREGREGREGKAEGEEEGAAPAAP